MKQNEGNAGHVVKSNQMKSSERKHKKLGYISCFFTFQKGVDFIRN